MKQRIARRSRLVAAGFVLLSFSDSALAHPEAALPPVFDPGPCIHVLDRDTVETAHFSYRVAMDDVTLTTGDIDLPDAMTHQFFAFRGAIVFEGFTPELWSFAEGDPALVALPLWISHSDVARSQASSDRFMLGYDLSVVTPDKVLETMGTLSDRWVRITDDDRRRPITLDQALLGVDWKLRDVEPGLYTLGGYIFSPPYNGWEIRAGLIKIKDANHDPPAAVVSRVQESLFGGQGRRVSACFDVPPGTRLRTYAQLEDQPGASWIEWGSERAIETGETASCYLPEDGLTGSVRMRFDLISPDGTIQSFYSPDTLVVLGGAAPCTESETLCCPESAAEGGEDSGLGAAIAPADPIAHGTGDAEASGCTVHAPGGAASLAGWLAFAFALGAFAFRARRHSE